MAACDFGTNTNPTKLTMGELSYDDTTKIVSWDKVANASGYELKIDSGSYSSSGITASGNKMQYTVAESTSGDYTVSVVAKGDGTNYTNSNAKTKTITYTADDVEKTTVQLVMSDLSYDDTTKIVSWDKVDNASGYSLRVGSSTKQASDITENGAKMQYVMNETHPGNYNVFVRALGSETETHIYKPSDETKVVANYTIAIQKEERQLTAPAIGFDEANGVIYFNTVANANGYDLQVKEDNGAYVNKTATFNSETNRMEYSLGTAYGNYTAKVKALGGKETDSLIYTTSPYSNEFQVNYQAPQQQVAYSEVEALIKEKAEIAWKEKNTFIASSFAGIEVKGINLEDGVAYLNVSRTTGDVYAVTFALGNLGNSLADICEHINNTTYTKSDISYNTQIQSQENTTLLVNALKKHGKISSDEVWATATQFGGSAGNRTTNVVVALKDGDLVSFTLTIAAMSSDSATIIAEYNETKGKGTFSNENTTPYTDLNPDNQTATQTSMPLWYQEQDQGM